MPALPPLREDLALLQGSHQRGGTASWLVHDPLQHRFIQIDGPTFAILALWRRCTSTEQLIREVETRIEAPLDEPELGRLVEFLDQHHLLQVSRKGWRDLAKADGAHKQSLPGWLAHNYLFLKIPLVPSERLLARTAPAVAMLGSSAALSVVLLCGLVGVYLVSRQWDQLVLAIQSLASVQGAVGLAAALFVVKALHELGHAYVATCYGCRVPTIGLAVVMMAPMLYTDVTDSWRLRDRRQRVAIDAAGIAVELAIACLATLAWAILPDGAARSIALLLATTSCVMSLAINLNPFMRFDGYYILADAVGIANLQPRAFRIGVWWTRELLFGLGERCPEPLDSSTIRGLVIYAWTTWLVRLVTYVGIALLAYAYFFKALGIAMFAFEMWFFVLRPLSNEFSAWWKLRANIMNGKRIYATATLLAAGLLLFVVPWSTTVHVPAMLEAQSSAQLFAPRPARVTLLHVKPGQFIEAGTVVAVLEVPDLDFDERAQRARLKAIDLRLARLSADALDRDDRIVLDSEQAALTMRLGAIAGQRTELQIKSPIAGVVAELDSALHPGRWITTKDRIALIVGRTEALVRGYVEESDIGRVEPGATGRFVPDDPQLPSLDVVLKRIAVSGTAVVDIGELATPSGGRIVANPNARQLLVPTSAQYLVELQPPLTPFSAPERKHRGLVHLTGSAESLLARTWRRVLRILVQESGA